MGRRPPTLGSGQISDPASGERGHPRTPVSEFERRPRVLVDRLAKSILRELNSPRRGAILDEGRFEGYNRQVPVLDANDARAVLDPGMEKSPDKVYGQYRRLQ